MKLCDIYIQTYLFFVFALFAKILNMYVKIRSVLFIISVSFYN